MHTKTLARAARYSLIGIGASALVGTLPATTSAQQAASGYVVPRTPWGDPDLQGKWPGTEMVGVPMQRDEKLGLRNVLNDEEFAERVQRAARQTEQDNADFDLETATSTPGGDVGGYRIRLGDLIDGKDRWWPAGGTSAELDERLGALRRLAEEPDG